MKLVFLGTPELAVPSLETLGRSHEIRLVVTRPDRSKGRGRRPAPPPVKLAAGRLGLPLWQPEGVRGAEPLARFSSAGAEIMVVVAYGHFLPRAVLDLFPLGAVNLHFSLLPAYRGAAPINWALIRGEKTTGVTTFRLTSRMDAGPVYLRRSAEILPGETAGELGARLAVLGAAVLEETLAGIAGGTLAPAPQDESRATLAPKLAKEDGRIDWRLPAAKVADRVRGVTPWPGAFTAVGGRTLKVWRAEAEEARSPAPSPPGTVVLASPAEGLRVAAGEGEVELLEVQPEGGRRMPARAYLAGHPVAPGARLA